MDRHYLDPYAILATLGFGVFLFNVIFNLLNNANTATTGRSLDVADIDLPLELSDITKFSIKDVSFVQSFDLIRNTFQRTTKTERRETFDT